MIIALLLVNLKTKLLLFLLKIYLNIKALGTLQRKWQISCQTKTSKLNRVNCSVIKQDKEHIDPITTGINEKARFVITGEIKRFEIIKRAEVTAAADKYRENSIAYVCIELQLIDVGQKKQLYKNDICGEVSGKNIEENSWKYIGKLSFNMENNKFSDTILGQAISQAIDQSSTHLARYMGLE